MDTPLVTVLMVTSNRCAYAKQAIDSILAQTFQDFEFVIINNNSSDNTEELVLSYTDPRIKYHKSKRHMLSPEAFNMGLDLAQAKYVAIQHDDDIAMPDRIERQYNHMVKNPDMGVCGGWLKKFGKSSSVLRVAPEKYWKESFLSCGPFFHAIFMLNKDILNKHNIRHNEQYRHIIDDSLICDIAGVATIGCVNDIILQYRVHAQQDSTIKKSNVTENESDMLHLSYFNTMGLKLTPEEELLLVHWVLDVQRYRDKKTLSKELYERVAALMEKILSYNEEVNYWNQDNLKVVISHLWRKACFRGLRVVPCMYRIYRDSIPSLQGFLEGRLKFYLFKVRRWLKIEGLDLS